MAITKKHLHVAVLVVILIGLIVAFVMSFVIQECYKSKLYTYDNLKDGLGPGLTYKNKSLRLMAERILEYKLTHEQGTTDDAFVNIFLVGKSPTPYKLTVENLSDLCVHKLITTRSEEFPKLIYYVPIFNHELYNRCIGSYDLTTKKFSNFDNSKSTKDIIIEDILKIGKDSTTTQARWQTVLNSVREQLQTDEFLYKVLNTGYSS